MAVIWQYTHDNTHYEVRSAGASRRLYTNGVFHSQWNPRRPVCGNVWDLLAIPAFFVSPEKLKRILVLGVGGGAVIRLLQQITQHAKITGIELNAVHLNIAKEYFEVTQDNVQLVQADAITWLKHYSGPPFDMIIEDLYGEHNGEPERVIDLNRDWMKLLNQNLTSNGILVMNTIGYKELKRSAYLTSYRTAKLFESAFRLSLPTYDNIIAVFLKKKNTIRNLKANIKSHKNIAIKNALLKLDYKAYKLPRY